MKKLGKYPKYEAFDKLYELMKEIKDNERKHIQTDKEATKQKRS